jgi:hypothetical protein
MLGNIPLGHYTGIAILGSSKNFLSSHLAYLFEDCNMKKKERTSSDGVRSMH